MIKTLINGSSSTITGNAVDVPSVQTAIAYQAVVLGAGAVSATVDIQVSLNGDNFVKAGTITLSGSGSASDGLVIAAPWRYTRAKVTAISGGVVTVLAGF